MPALSNPKHERFAQLRAKGLTADDAYAEAGYSPNRQNAHRLTTNDDILRRVAELQERAAQRTEITVAGITERLLAIATKGEAASDAALLAVARASLMDAAKLNGLIVDKVKSEVETRTISDQPLSHDEWEAQHVPRPSFQ